MFTAILLLGLGAEPPKYTVVNKCPALEVVNRTLPPPARAERFTATDGATYERHPDGVFRPVPQLAPVGPPLPPPLFAPAWCPPGGA